MVVVANQDDIDTGKRKMLLIILYDKKITIPEFKEYCDENGLDYNNIEHCCGCAGCYDPQDLDSCPNSEYYDCKIVDPKFCNICGHKAEVGYPLEDENDKVVYTFWTCLIHSQDKKLENELRKGTPVERIVAKWNR